MKKVKKEPPLEHFFFTFFKITVIVPTLPVTNKLLKVAEEAC
jgi:hypothetical protein